MLRAINSWGDYRAKVREFDAVLEHAKAVSSILVGLTAPIPHVGYAAQMFSRLVAQASVVRSLAVDPHPTGAADLRSIPSACAVARSAVEAHDAFEYIAGHDVSAVERGFRLLLWELHDVTRCLKMAAVAAWPEADAEALGARAARLRAELEGHDYLAYLHAELQTELRRRLARGDAPAFHLSQRQRCALSGVDADWHNAVTLQLSQHVHTLPSSLQQLSQVAPAAPEAPRLAALPVVATLPFLARITQSMTGFMAGAPEPPSRTARTMAWWRQVAEQGAAAMA